jgi:hypothetical protein
MSSSDAGSSAVRGFQYLPRPRNSRRVRILQRTCEFTDSNLQACSCFGQTKPQPLLRLVIVGITAGQGKLLPQLAPPPLLPANIPSKSKKEPFLLLPTDCSCQRRVAASPAVCRGVESHLLPVQSRIKISPSCDPALHAFQWRYNSPAVPAPLRITR